MPMEIFRLTKRWIQPEFSLLYNVLISALLHWIWDLKIQGDATSLSKRMVVLKQEASIFQPLGLESKFRIKLLFRPSPRNVHLILLVRVCAIPEKISRLMGDSRIQPQFSLSPKFLATHCCQFPSICFLSPYGFDSTRIFESEVRIYISNNVFSYIIISVIFLDCRIYRWTQIIWWSNRVHFENLNDKSIKQQNTQAFNLKVMNVSATCKWRPDEFSKWEQSSIVVCVSGLPYICFIRWNIH